MGGAIEDFADTCRQVQVPNRHDFSDVTVTLWDWWFGMNHLRVGLLFGLRVQNRFACFPNAWGNLLFIPVGDVGATNQRNLS